MVQLSKMAAVGDLVSDRQGLEDVLDADGGSRRPCRSYRLLQLALLVEFQPCSRGLPLLTRDDTQVGQGAQRTQSLSTKPKRAQILSASGSQLRIAWADEDRVNQCKGLQIGSLSISRDPLTQAELFRDLSPLTMHIRCVPCDRLLAV